ncbi:TPA_asm: hypothetical protein [Physarum slime mold MELD virus]|nr:TPA_asm: hypothetical protein [Physarum slime mold MELD virus]
MVNTVNTVNATVTPVTESCTPVPTTLVATDAQKFLHENESDSDNEEELITQQINALIDSRVHFHYKNKLKHRICKLKDRLQPAQSTHKTDHLPGVIVTQPCSLLVREQKGKK